MSKPAIKWIAICVYAITVMVGAYEYFQNNKENTTALLQQSVDEELAIHKQYLARDFFEMSTIEAPEKLSILVYEEGQLRSWSSNQFVPTYQELVNQKSSPSYLQTRDGHYLVSFRDRNDQRVFIISTLVQEFQSSRTTLDTYSNERIFQQLKGLIATASGEQINVGEDYFFFNFGPHYAFYSGSVVLLFWLAWALTAILTFHKLWDSQFQSAFFIPWIILAAASLKGLSLVIPGFEELSPELSFWLIKGNLLDILISCILFNGVFVASLIHLTRLRKIKGLLQTGRKIPILFGALLFSISIGLHFLYFHVIMDLMEITGVNLDITSTLKFDLSRSLFFALILCLAALLFWNVQFLSRLYAQFKFGRLVGVAIVLAVGVIVWLAPLQYKEYIVIPHSLLWILIYNFSFSRNLIRISYVTFFYIIIVIGALSFTNSIAIYKNFERQEVINKQAFGEQQLTPRDPLTEKYLIEVKEKIQRDPVIRSRFLSPLLSKEMVKIKVSRQYLSSYFDRFEVDLSLYDIIGDRLDGKDPASKTELLDQVAGFSIEDEGLFFVENWENLGRSKYLLWVPIMNGEVEIGGIAIDLMAKKVIPNSVYPSVLRNYQKSSKGYDYVLLREGALVFAKGNYSFDVFSNPSMWEKLISSDEGIELMDYHLLAIEADDALMIVISKKYELRAFLSNFSFQFLIFLSFVGLAFVGMRWSQPGQQLSLANRIQLYLGFSFILPLLIVSAVILNLLNSSYRDEIIRNYQKRAITIAENIYQPMEDFDQNQINREDLYEVIGNAATFSQVDMNLYSTRGQLVISNQPEIYANNLVTTRIHPKPWELIAEKPDQSVVMEESIGNLNFKVVYQGVIDHHSGDLLGIISIPFFDSKNHLNRQQVEVFANLVTVFTIIFLSSVLIGYVILRNITLPLTALSKRLRQTTLEETNEPVAYSAVDEIGQLVGEYNRMLEKLEASKAALAQSQKETAWKEIARQVAHEIKNPLTPMRLKIQQIMRTKGDDEHLTMGLSSLINQIDTLSEIADSFSAFAKMPPPNNEKVAISDLLLEVAQLYQTEEVEIDCDVESGKWVFADMGILSRVFNNLLLNGIQSVTAGQAHLQVSLKEKDRKIVIQVIDNGEGIPEDYQKKIFTPYFSTKEKGSGIGLAIAKKGIEQAGGSIWFESEVDRGTIFTVILPAVIP